MTPLLQVDDVKVWFGGVKAVDGVSIALEPGKIYGLVGPNGSGKTTLVNAISGVTPLTAGRITFAGQDITAALGYKVSRAGIARTFQTIKLIPTLTVRENVLLAADWLLKPGGDRRASAAAREERADAALARLGLEQLAHEDPTELPYGTQRRVEIARALAGEPELLLLDEPIAGMNREERDDIAETLVRLRETGLTQLVIEHDLRTLLRVCDHLFVMNFGRLIAEGPPQETAAGAEVQEAYLGRRYDAA